jgi:hypothetical protein
MRSPARLTLLALALLACGEPLVDGRYLGEPLYRIEGWVHLAIPPESLDPVANGGALRLAVFWAPARGESLRLDETTEQAVATTGIFPARFEVSLFQPPAARLQRALPDADGTAAFALLLAYLDRDGDARWDRDAERIVGGTYERLIVYTPTGFSSPTFGALDPGFGRLVGNRPDCSEGPLTFSADREAQVNLVVSLDVPRDVLLDPRCEGGPTAWTGLCPPLARVRTVCRESGNPDPHYCPTCEGLLWPVGAEQETCRLWLERCLAGAAATECEQEYQVCAGVAGPPPDADCDLACVCERVLRDCYAAHDDNPACMDRFDNCMGASSGQSAPAPSAPP